MQISFVNQDLERLCSEQRVAQRQLGKPCSKKLRSRLADLNAAGTVTDLVAGRPHHLTRDRAGQFSVDLHGGTRLVFAPAGQPPEDEHGGIDWARVTSVQIVFIGDYHD